MNKILSLLKLNNLAIVYLIFSIVMSFQPFLVTKERQVKEPDHPYTEYNNYVIFKNSHRHLVENYNLYQIFESEQWDFYKYSPTFAFFFGLFHLFPDLVGICLWNILNAMILIWGIYNLSFLTDRQKAIFALLALLEANTNLVNTQANGVMAGTMLLFYSYQEKGNYRMGNFLLAASVFIKIFSIVGFLMLLFYPNRWRRIANAFVYGMFFLLAPTIVTGINGLFHQYINWFHLLQEDSSFGAGLSLHRFLTVVLNYDFDQFNTLLIGITGIIISFSISFFSQEDSFRQRLLFWSQLMIWVIIFNHRAESPTFIISICGILLLLTSQFSGRIFWISAILVITFTSLISTDVFPLVWRNGWMQHWVVKAVPSIFVWISIIALQVYLFLRKSTISTNRKFYITY